MPPFVEFCGMPGANPAKKPFVTFRSKGIAFNAPFVKAAEIGKHTRFWLMNPIIKSDLSFIQT
jgi:hypothetical protein